MMAHVLSGGLATELERCGYGAESDPLFGSSLLLNNPEAIVSAHKSFLQSGADIISTATYQASRDSLQKYLGLTFEQSFELIRDSVRVARKAVTQHVAQTGRKDKIFQVAGSVGPYGATLRNASEYGGAYAADVTEESLRQWHRPRIQALVGGGVDLLALETIPTMHEGIALVSLLREFPSIKAWLSFSCKDGEHTCHGHSFAEAVRTCEQLDSGGQLVAIGVNCTNPMYVSSLLASTSMKSNRNRKLPFVVYPNSGETWTKEFKWAGRDKRCQMIASHVSDWMDLGARYVGGCCRVTPAEISEISGEVRKHVLPALI